MLSTRDPPQNRGVIHENGFRQGHVVIQALKASSHDHQDGFRQDPLCTEGWRWEELFMETVGRGVSAKSKQLSEMQVAPPRTHTAGALWVGCPCPKPRVSVEPGGPGLTSNQAAWATPHPTRLGPEGPDLNTAHNNVKIILQRWMGSGSGGSELNLHLSLHYVIGNVKEEI